MLRKDFAENWPGAGESRTPFCGRPAPKTTACETSGLERRIVSERCLDDPNLLYEIKGAYPVACCQSSRRCSRLQSRLSFPHASTNPSYWDVRSRGLLYRSQQDLASPRQQVNTMKANSVNGDQYPLVSKIYAKEIAYRKDGFFLIFIWCFYKIDFIAFWESHVQPTSIQ